MLYYYVSEDIPPTQIPTEEVAELLGFIPERPGTFRADDDYFVVAKEK